MGRRWLALCALCVGAGLVALGLGLAGAGSAGARPTAGAGAAPAAAAAARPTAAAAPLPACAGVLRVRLAPLRAGAADSRVLAASCAPARGGDAVGGRGR